MKIQGLFFALICIFSLTLTNSRNHSSTLTYPVNGNVKWEIDPLKSRVKFIAQNMAVFNVEGEFMNYKGEISSVNENFSNPEIDFTIFTNSVNTNNTKRDKHLKSEDFLNVEKYPEIHFVSKKFDLIQGDKYVLIGELTILGHNRSEYFQVTRYPNDSQEKSIQTLSFKITGEIDRQLYGLRFKEGISDDLVGDKVKIDITIHLKKVN